jgi:hypothetical protein
VRPSGALDPVSHTLLTELQVPNADGQLLPGMSAEIKFELPQTGRTLLIPSRAIVADPDGPKVLTVDAQNVIRSRPVTLGSDLGDKVEILSGLDAGDALIADPSAELREGLEVKVQRESEELDSTNQGNIKREKIMKRRTSLTAIVNAALVAHAQAAVTPTRSSSIFEAKISSLACVN